MPGSQGRTRPQSSTRQGKCSLRRAAGGFRFTLRRVFYALVSAEVLPNTERAYKNLSATLDRARWEGLLSLDCLDDLGRVAAAPASWENAAEALTALAHQYRSDWPYVEAWAEKAAVAGILEPMVLQYGVTFLACRGFASLTAIAESAVRFQGRPASCSTWETMTPAVSIWTATYRNGFIGWALTWSCSGWR